VVRPPVDPIQACPQCRAAEKKTNDPDGVAVQSLIETLSSPRSPRPRRKRFRLWTKKDGVTMSEESVRQPGQSEAIGASSQDGGHREHAELVNGLDGVLDVRGGLAAAHDGANHTVHGTEP
jgi:hypothetical protein